MLVGLALLACAPEEPQLPEPEEVTDIDVSPAEITITTGPDGGDAYQFQATATFGDGTVQALELADWTLSNRSVGEIDETGFFTPSTTNGGVTWISARFDGVEGRSTVTVLYEDYQNDEGLDISGFATATPNHYDFWLYPEDGVALPRNTPRMTFMWADMGAQVYRMRFRSAVTNYVVYTAATSFSVDEETWENLVATNAGGTLNVELAAMVNGTLYQDDPIAITVNRMDTRGTIVYWSTNAQGFMQVPYGDVASELLTVNQNGHCMGCHVVSSQGTIAFSYDGGNGALGLWNINTGADVIAYNSGPVGNFKAFSPDGALLLTTYAGALLLYDATNGAYLGEVPVGRPVAQVDWSPDGARIALTLTWGHTYDWSMSGGEIAIMDYYGNGQFGAPTVIVANTPGYNYYYPAFSPDGEWIAFNRSTGDGYDDPDAEVWVVHADGTAAPVPLTLANQTTGLYNSWPRWAPLPDDDVLWIAFSSRRAYGNVVSGVPQLWVTGFDPARAQAGVDPSWAAFWLPNQDPAQGNHIPVWVDR